ncbi:MULTISPECIES: hypothetical protein [unclassified Streptomyces]|uniref:hypothetical protein n=1 Tax=unclassified Streptomyces TaxID=2593676 RepID=UPI001873FC50|nr:MULTISPECIES: hypothetical protein [unclassified Streptomyces]
MAHIVERARSDGETSYIVRWRAGAARTGKYESEIFSDPDAAKKFKDLVNGFGQQWPPGWIRGQGFVADLRSAEEMFEPFALKQISLLTGVQGDTRAKYRRLVEQNMSPWFKSCSVRDGEGGISREMVQQWVNDLAAGKAAPLDPADHRPRTKYKPKTIGNQHGLLHTILQAAVDAEPQLRATNPCAFTRLPRLDGEQVEEEMVFLEREEYRWIYECMAEDAKDLADTLAETGVRWGEGTALQARDLRRRNGRPALRVQRAWKRDEDGKPYLGAPKTKRSRRTIVITWKLDAMLRRRAKGKAPDALLFTGPGGGRWDARLGVELGGQQRCGDLGALPRVLAHEGPHPRRDVRVRGDLATGTGLLRGRAVRTAEDREQGDPREGHCDDQAEHHLHGFLRHPPSRPRQRDDSPTGGGALQTQRELLAVEQWGAGLRGRRQDVADADERARRGDGASCQACLARRAAQGASCPGLFWVRTSARSPVANLDARSLASAYDRSPPARASCPTCDVVNFRAVSATSDGTAVRGAFSSEDREVNSACGAADWGRCGVCSAVEATEQLVERRPIERATGIPH